MPEPSGALRIGPFSERVGVKPDLLRAWERRYGLLRPTRSAGGFRLYTDADARRITRMRDALASGLSAAQAAEAAIAAEPPGATIASGGDGVAPLDIAVSRVLQAVARYDEGALRAVLDDSFAGVGIERTVGEVIVPALRAIGSGWEAGTMLVGQEHLASNVIRGRLQALKPLVGFGEGPLAVLACAPGEQHDISLLAFGVLLQARAWKVVFMGANTPLEPLQRAAQELRPALTVVAAFDERLLQAQEGALRELARTTRTALAGPGASASLAERAGAERLGEDLVAAAAGISG
jgi:DNA-binding transcriptional MerR regulator